MTVKKSLKGRVRARMAKTGERYTAARRQLIDKAGAEVAGSVEVASRAPGLATSEEREEAANEAVQPAMETAAPGSGGVVHNPGMSDAAIRRGTGRGWDEWLAVLDAWGGTSRTHPEIATYLCEVQGVDGWWAQGVTVGYERARGMRAVGQLPDGYGTSASKTVAVPVERLYEAFVDPALRAHWLPDAPFTISSTTPDKAVNGAWADKGSGGTGVPRVGKPGGATGGEGAGVGASRVAVLFTAKGSQKSQVALQHRRLVDAEAAAAMKVYWRERLAALDRWLTQDGDG
ncbi:MAG TPA: hypothetical protein VNM48_22985 [Chloroflexota bacterium]|nr:hypothetical protein [Chloroflexota bacterium]